MLSVRVKYFLITLICFFIAFLLPLNNISWWYRASFILFFLFLFWIIGSSSSVKDEVQKLQKFILWLFGFSFILLFTTRIIPFLRWGEAPLGYDTGIYLRNFETIIRTQQTDVMGVLVQIIASTGVSVNFILHGFFVFFNILLGFSLYLASRSIFRTQFSAVSSLLIFALSIPQYEVYNLMTYRMMVALVLFMVTITLFSRGSYLAILTGGFAGALHMATLFVFGVAYICYIIVMMISQIIYRQRQNKNHEKFVFSLQRIFSFVGVDQRETIFMFGTGFGILILALLLNFSEFRGYLPYLTEYKFQISNFDQFLGLELSGLFLNLDIYRMTMVFYTPFAFLGLWMAIKHIKRFWNKKETSGMFFILIFLIVSLFFTNNRFIFHQRYLIVLDLLLILFSGYALTTFLARFYGSSSGKILIGIFILGFSGSIIYYSWVRTPLILTNELYELKKVSSQLKKEEAYGMATDSYYTPWVYGYLTERTIAPGYFINYWSFDEWQKFWRNGTDDERILLLDRYGKRPIYIFLGSHQINYDPMLLFLKKYSTRVTEHIWRYQN